MSGPGEEIGARIRSARRAKGLSVNALSRLIDRHLHTVYTWEQGKGLPTVPDALALARVLDVTIGWLLEGERTTTRRKESAA